MKWNCGHPGESLSNSGPGEKSRRVIMLFFLGQKTTSHFGQKMSIERPLKVKMGSNRQVSPPITVTPWSWSIYLSGSSHTAQGHPGTGRKKTTRVLAHSSSGHGRERTTEA